jgi:hypothetical protein
VSESEGGAGDRESGEPPAGAGPPVASRSRRRRYLWIGVAVGVVVAAVVVSLLAFAVHVVKTRGGWLRLGKKQWVYTPPGIRVFDLAADRNSDLLAFTGWVKEETKGQIYDVAPEIEDASPGGLFVMYAGQRPMKVLDGPVLQVALSPDARRAAVVSGVQPPVPGQPPPRTAVVDLETRSHFWLTEGAHYTESRSIWSPDGKYIALGWCTEAEAQSAREQARRERAPAATQRPVWVAVHPVIIASGGGDARELGGPAWLGGWSADGRRFICTRDRDAWSVKPDGSGARQLTHLGDVICCTPVPLSDDLLLTRKTPDGPVLQLQRQGTKAWSIKLDMDPFVATASSPDGKLTLVTLGAGVARVDLATGDLSMMTPQEGGWQGPVWLDGGDAVACVHNSCEVWLFPHARQPGRILLH